MKKVTEEKQKHNNAAKLLQHEGSLAIEELLQENQQKFIQETLEVEVEEFLGRKRYARSEQLKGYRNGSYPKKVILPGSHIIINKLYKSRYYLTPPSNCNVIICQKIF